MSVEQLVMQAMEAAHEDGAVSLCSGEEGGATEGSSSVASHDPFLEHFCGGWVGWHCEGSPLKTIFGLVMWSELFPCAPPPAEPPSPPAAPQQQQAVSPPLVPPARSGPAPPAFPACVVADVFQSPYQDAPLDLLTPGGLFFRNRQAAIEQKLRWVQAASAEDIMTYLGEVLAALSAACPASLYFCSLLNSVPFLYLTAVPLCLNFVSAFLACCRCTERTT